MNSLFCLFLILLPQFSAGNLMMLEQSSNYTQVRTTAPTPWKILLTLENHLIAKIKVVEIAGTCTHYEPLSPFEVPPLGKREISTSEKSCWKEFHQHHYRALTIKIKSDDHSFTNMFYMIELDDWFPNKGRKCLVYSASKNFLYDQSVVQSQVNCGDNKDSHGVPIIEAIVKVKYHCPIESIPGDSIHQHTPDNEEGDLSRVSRQTNTKTTVHLYVTNLRREDVYIYRGVLWECWESSAIRRKQKISGHTTRHFILGTMCGTGSPSRLYYYLNIKKDMDNYPWAIGYLEVDYWEGEDYKNRLCRAGAGNTPAAEFKGDSLMFTATIDYCVRSSDELDASDNYYVTVYP